jgi:AsmA family protein
MKWKWILGIVCIAFLLLIGAIYVILLSYDYDSLKPQIRQAVKDATGRDLTIGGDIKLKIRLAPTLVVEDVSFQNAAWGSQPEMAKIKYSELKVRLFPLLSHRIEIVRLVLIEPEILIETDASGRSNLPIQDRVEGSSRQRDESGAGGWKLSHVTFQELRIEKGAVTYINHESNKKYAATVTALTANATGPEKGLVRLKATGSYNGESFKIEGTTGSLAAFTKPSVAWPVDLTLSTGYAVLALAGGIDDPSAGRGMKLNFSLKGNDLAGLGRFFGQLSGLKGPFDFSGQISDIGHKAYSISNLKIIQAESNLSGYVELNLAGERPMTKASLEARKLDLRHIQFGPKTPAPPGKVFPNKPLSFQALAKADAEIKLRAPEVLLPDLSLSNLDVNMALKNGELDVRTLKAGLGKGSIDGKLTLKPQGKTALLTLIMKLRTVDIKYLAKVVKGLRSVAGNVDADLDIRARGNSVAGLMGGSSGKAVFLMGRGSVDNKYIDLLGGDLGSGLFRLLNPFEKEKPFTSINCFVGAFTIKNGLARAGTLVLNTQYMVVVGEGGIDLRTERLNLSLKPVPKEGVGASMIGRLGVSASELMKPLKLGGTLARPRLVIDPTQTAIALGKTIGSVTLFGPAGIVAALLGKTSDDETSCAAAILAAKKGVKVEKRKGITGQVQEKAVESIEDIRDKLKRFFGN